MHTRQTAHCVTHLRQPQRRKGAISLVHTTHELRQPRKHLLVAHARPCKRAREHPHYARRVRVRVRQQHRTHRRLRPLHATRLPRRSTHCHPPPPCSDYHRGPGPACGATRWRLPRALGSGGYSAEGRLLACSAQHRFSNSQYPSAFTTERLYSEHF